MNRFIAAVVLLASPCLAAQTSAPTETIATQLKQENHALTESEEITTAIQHNDREGAFSKLNPILAQCESRPTKPGEKIVYLDSYEQFLEFIALPNNTGKIRWVRDYCPLAYNTAAFLYVAANDKDNAMKYLSLAIESAPFWAEPHNELGYFLGVQKDFEAALASYEKAIELADKYKNTASVKPLSLRGLRFILTEMGELERSKKAYEDSLLIEPDNALAKNELEYIRQQQLKN